MRNALTRQQQLARQELEQLRAAFPSLFDKHGKPVVAVLRFPRKDGQ